MRESEPRIQVNLLRCVMKTRLKSFVEALLMLLLALSSVTVAASAQTTSPPAKKKTTQTKNASSYPAQTGP